MKVEPTLTPFEIRQRHPSLDFKLYQQQRSEFIEALSTDSLNASCFITLNYNSIKEALWEDISKEEARHQLVKVLLKASKLLNLHLEGFASFDFGSAKDGKEFPHIHLALLSDGGNSHEINKTIKELWSYGSVEARPYIIQQLDENLSYIYEHPFPFKDLGLFCGRKEHGRGKRCPCIKKARNRRNVA